MGNSLPIVTADILPVVDSACLVIESLDLLKSDEKESLVTYSQVQIV